MRPPARPGTLNIGTTTVGLTNHLAATLLKAMVGLDGVFVPYRTPADLLTAALRDDTDLTVQSYRAGNLPTREIQSNGSLLRILWPSPFVSVS
jgi:tripartite-type tricarboxylate transporter receptor subunit TctC